MSRKVSVVGGECYVRTSNLDMSATPYVAYKIKSAHHAVAASLHIMLKHMADMHSLMFDVISEKYKIPYDDIVEALNSDPRVQKMLVEPTIHSLNYFTQEDLDRFQALWEAPPEEEEGEKEEDQGLVEKMEAVTIEEAPKKVKGRVIKKKAVLVPTQVQVQAEAQVQVQVQAEAPVQVPAPTQVKKRIIIKKKPAESTESTE